MYTFGISTRKPRTPDYLTLDPHTDYKTDIGGTIVRIENNRNTAVYLKTKV